MIKLYGNKHWPGCKPVREFLLENDIHFDYVDISESIKNLKEFLKIRDFREEYNEIKEANYVGIPMLLFNNNIYFENDIDIELVKEIKCIQD